jgi:uncharacterized protein (TIGR02466 family)|tara:strand:+ start:330 stop:908 length:579 start_codon:yes stop_codon:yes gene_type:complete
MIHNLFATPVGEVINKQHSDIEKEHVDECLRIKKNVKKGGDNWHSPVFNTCGTHQIHLNPKFNIISKFVYDNICEFADVIGYKNTKIICGSSWINYYESGDYQEEHDHIEDQLVSIYYLQTSKNCGNLRVNGPLLRTMPPFFDKKNPYTYQSMDFTPVPGKLIMFKSDIRHSVARNESDNMRISLAYNFKIL